MKKKKLLTLSLAAVMATSALPVSALAEGTPASGTQTGNGTTVTANKPEKTSTEEQPVVGGAGAGDQDVDPLKTKKDEAQTGDKTGTGEATDPAGENSNNENGGGAGSGEGNKQQSTSPEAEAAKKLQEAKTAAKEEVSKLSELTDTEKKEYSDKIDNATEIDAVNKLSGEANGVNKTKLEAKKKDQEAEAKKELEQAKKDLVSAIKAYEDLDKTIYTDESLKTYKDAYVAAKALDANATAEQVKAATKALKDARDKLIKNHVAKEITNVTVYYNRVEGYAEPYSTVRLYKDGSYTGDYATANANGKFSISYSFGSSDYRYWNGYRYWDGTKYWDWDDYYRHYGYYPDRYYDGYYYNYYYNLNKFSLKSYSGTTLLSEYSITNSNGYNYYNYYYDGRYYDRYYYNYDYKVYPTSLSLDSARDTVSGYLKSYPNRYVAVYRNGSFLGSSYVDSNGYFKVDLNTYIGSTSNLDFYVDRYHKETTPKTTTTDTKTFRTVITIGSKNITQRINGADRTKTMDVEAYIKDGRTMLPIRFVAESLGYDVTYRNSSRSAIISDGKDIIIFYLDSADFYVNGVKKQFQVKPEIKNDRTMLPISEVARALGLTHGDKGSGRNIEWDSATRTVVIELKK
ncbi:GA module-containing protein [Peptoniphilus sp. MSJ-1]|uniref:GA module-containing protein n=1 Tax=Peptoniphilus ovalis TaxID=2841503 RepID=A0ABS6FDV6_9FIRM|nr:stalk domain-containing protein [Peptoniphilus ovalis]MBU5668352.1 GA module-containing protein [Peptoniphilus ovalis]